MHSQQYRSRRASRRHSRPNMSMVSQANGWGRGEWRECSWSTDFANLRFLSSVVWCLLRPRLHVLDPRYKGRLFAPEWPDELEAIKQWAIEEARFEPSNPPANEPQPPPAKKAHAGPLDVLDAILGAPCSAHLIRINRVTSGCWIVCVSAGRRYQSTEWWAANAAKYPLLAAEAKCYLSAPPTSVASEHVFSTDKRLLPKRWKKSNKNRDFRIRELSVTNANCVHCLGNVLLM